MGKLKKLLLIVTAVILILFAMFVGMTIGKSDDIVGTWNIAYYATDEDVIPAVDMNISGYASFSSDHTGTLTIGELDILLEWEYVQTEEYGKTYLVSIVNGDSVEALIVDNVSSDINNMLIIRLDTENGLVFDKL